MNDSTSVPTIEELNSEEVVRVIPTIIYLGILIITGTLGNLIVLYVYKKKYGPSNTKYFIICLSVIDLFTCCVVLPLEITVMTMQYTLKHAWLCKASRFGNTISTLSSAALLLTIAIDRYRRMCKPFEWQIARKYAKGLCAGCITVGLLLSWPALFVYGRSSVSTPRFNLNGTDCSVDDSLADTLIPLANNIVYAGIFLVGVVSICIMYCCIGLALHKHVQRMPKGFRATTKRRLTQRTIVSTVCDSEVIVDYNANGPNGHVLPLPDTQSVLNTTHTDEECSVAIRKDYVTDKVTGDSTKCCVKYNAISSEEKGYSTSLENGHCVCSESRRTNSVDSVRTNSNEIPTSDPVTSEPEAPIAIRERTRTSTSTENSYQSSNVRKTSLLMLIISVTFVVSYLPHLLLMLIREINGTFEEGLSDSGRIAYKFFLRTYFLNCATNPVIYCIYGSHFRASCKELFWSFFRRTETTDKVFMSMNPY